MPPQGVVPEGTSDGEEFDLVCTFRMKGTNVCMTQMGDEKMPGYDDKSEKPDYKETAKTMQADMGSAMQQPGAY